MASLEFTLKKIDEIRNYTLEEIKDDDLICKKYKKFCKVLNYFELFLIFICAVNGGVLIFAFSSLIGVPVGIASTTLRLTIFAITAGIKKYKSIITIK